MLKIIIGFLEIRRRIRKMPKVNGVHYPYTKAGKAAASKAKKRKQKRNKGGCVKAMPN
jgi:hypothetical protein